MDDLKKYLNDVLDLEVLGLEVSGLEVLAFRIFGTSCTFIREYQR